MTDIVVNSSRILTTNWTPSPFNSAEILRSGHTGNKTLNVDFTNTQSFNLAILFILLNRSVLSWENLLALVSLSFPSRELNTQCYTGLLEVPLVPNRPGISGYQAIMDWQILD